MTIRPAALLLACLLISLPLAAAPPAWIERSNTHTQLLLDLTARHAPEAAAGMGIEGHDQRTLQLTPAARAAMLADSRAVLEQLRMRLPGVTHPRERQDLEILIRAIEDDLAGEALQDEYLLYYQAVDRLVFNSIRSLLDARTAAQRRPAAVARLRRYAGYDGAIPMTEQVQQRSSAALDNPALVGPYRVKVEQDLARSAQVVQGLRSLFADSGLDGWQEPLATLEAQLAAHNVWVRETLLPRARTNHRLPAAVYAHNLKQFGVDIAPEELLRRALISFSELQTQLQTLAPVVAAAQDIDASDYRDVIRALRARQLPNDQVLGTYHARLETIEGLLHQHAIVSVPERAASIRLASAAESAIQPAPHMSPPRLIGNTGEYGEFVLTQRVTTEDAEDLHMDDFTHDAATWTLTAHEARPGHEMQFAAIVEQGVSQARAIYAFNSVNVEGWALYAEAVMQPYLPVEGQLIALQHRLLRAARAVLDPMLNLGLTTPERAAEVLREDVVLSAAMVKQEVDRYTFRMPGQATSYFHGYQQLLAIRSEAELALGDAFREQAFHDFVLAQGLLPPALLRAAVLEQWLPEQQRALAAR